MNVQLIFSFKVPLSSQTGQNAQAGTSAAVANTGPYILPFKW